MKWLVLQLVTVYCLVIMPVTGKMRERVKIVTKPPIYILPEQALSRCATVPNYYDCRNKCKLHSDCIYGYECCSSTCGLICMKKQEPETTTKNNSPNNPSTTVASTVVTTSEMLSTSEGEQSDST